MKRIVIGFMALVATGVLAQTQGTDKQAGTPALLEAANGKQARVFLQRLVDDQLTFQPNKSTREMSVPVSKINSLTFYPKYDADALAQQFNDGDYAGIISTLGPIMEPFWEYMTVENNLRDPFCVLMDAYLKVGNYSEVRKAADILMATGDPTLVPRAQVSIALVALAENDLETVRKIRGEVESEAAGLYLQACIERAEDRPKDAIKTVTTIIIDHGNDVEWLGRSELLCAHLYVDMLSTNSMIGTNSPLHTARQVKNIYSGTSVAADAEKLWISLGGADVEATYAAEKAAREAEEEAAREKRKAEELAKEEAEEKARMEAEEMDEKEDVGMGDQDADAVAPENAASTNMTTATEMESE